MIWWKTVCNFVDIEPKRILLALTFPYIFFILEERLDLLNLINFLSSKDLRILHKGREKEEEKIQKGEEEKEKEE